MIIVEHQATRSRFALVGTGYGVAQTSRPSALLGSLLPTESEEVNVMVCLCDRTGKLAWCPSDEIRVLSIRGVELGKCSELASFEEHESRARESEPAPSEPMRCVVCNEALTTPECPNCN